MIFMLIKLFLKLLSKKIIKKKKRILLLYISCGKPQLIIYLFILQNKIIKKKNFIKNNLFLNKKIH